LSTEYQAKIYIGALVGPSTLRELANGTFFPHAEFAALADDNDVIDALSRDEYWPRRFLDYYLNNDVEILDGIHVYSLGGQYLIGVVFKEIQSECFSPIRLTEMVDVFMKTAEKLRILKLAPK
jgi:hypothetical protein